MSPFVVVDAHGDRRAAGERRDEVLELHVRFREAAMVLRRAAEEMRTEGAARRPQKGQG